MNRWRTVIGFLLVLLCTARVPSGACAEQAPAQLPPDPPFVEQDTSGQTLSVIEKRLSQEQQAKGLAFSILPHKPNYLLPITYNASPNNDAYATLTDERDQLDKLEVKFQLSIKTPLWENMFGSTGTLYVAYSQVAFWQAYNSKISSPFREINFEPETFVSFNTGFDLFGMRSEIMTIGFNHQSNGRSRPLSRSWNRIMAQLPFCAGTTCFVLKPWFRIPESAQDDDNPSMEKYYGYGELFVVQKLGEHTVSMMLRNNLRTSQNKGAIQLDWSFPLHKKLRGYVQYFNGYGESLVDYNHANNRLGIGVMLTDWL